VPAALFQPDSEARLPGPDFRHYFVTYFVRRLALRTWWVGALLGAWVVWRRGGPRDLPWGLIAGAVAGLVGGATLACAFLVFELVPHAVWHVLGNPGGDVIYALGFMALSLMAWAGWGAGLGLVLWLLPPARRAAVDPLQRPLAKLFRLCGLGGLADRWAPG
jgi:hypothetical protein